MDRLDLDVFDFDGTLINPPGPCAAPCTAIDAASVLQNHYIWWDSPESLDTEIFDLVIFEGVAKLANEKPDAFKSVITHRSIKVKDSVEKILYINKFKYHHIDFGGRTEKSKVEMLSVLLDKMGPVGTVRIFEDSFKHIHEYKRLADSRRYDIRSFEYYMVNTNNVFRLNADVIGLLAREIVTYTHFSGSNWKQ